MNVPRLIDRALWGWTVWRMRRQREREMPELRELRKRREACRRMHRKGAAATERAARAAIHGNLEGRA